jgi:hypothetical protein
VNSPDFVGFLPFADILPLFGGVMACGFEVILLFFKEEGGIFMGAMTLEDALAVIDRNNAAFRAEMALFEKSNAEALAKIDKALAESRAEREASIAQYNASLAAFKAERKKSDEERKKADEKFDRMHKSLGSFQRNLGEMVEFMLIPKVRQKINRCGHNFNILSPNKQYIDSRNGNILEEVDLLLENCEEALALEIKSNFKVKDVQEHLRLLKFLRKNESTTGMTGRVMYAGIAGITISEAVRKSALASGMYVITIHEEDERVDVIPPDPKGRW